MSRQTTEEKIICIENGLMPGMQIESMPSRGMNILERMRYHHIPSVSIAMVNDGSIEWSKTYNLLSDDVVAVDTLMQAGSISKPVAAVVALKLVEMGILNLDHDVNEFLTRWKLPESEFTEIEKVTLRKLLSHTAGLSVHGFGGYESSVTLLPTLPQILNGAEPANSERVLSNEIPGEKCVYSGGGTTIVQLLIEDAVKKYKQQNPDFTGLVGNTFSELAKELIFDPLQMNHSTYEIIRPEEPRSNLFASAHSPDGKVLAGKWHIYPESAAAGLWTTASDLARFIVGIQTNRLLSAEIHRDMLTQQINSDFGLGFEIDPNGVQFSHSGVNEGFQSLFVGFSNVGRGIAIMVNSDNGMQLIREMMPAIAKIYEWPQGEMFKLDIKKITAVAPNIFQKYIGVYEATLECGDIIRFNVQIKEGKLFFAAPFPGPTSDHQKFELYAESETKFFSLEGQFDVSISEDGSELHAFGQKAQKLPEYRMHSAPVSQASLVASIGLNSAIGARKELMDNDFSTLENTHSSPA